MTAPPQVRLDLLLELEDAGDRGLCFGVSLDGDEARPGHAEAQWDPEQLKQRCPKQHRA